jgi:hypothetical protein
MSFKTEEELLRRLDPTRVVRDYTAFARHSTWLKGSTEIVTKPGTGSTLVAAGTTTTLNSLAPTANEEIDIIEAQLVDLNHVDALDNASFCISPTLQEYGNLFPLSSGAGGVVTLGGFVATIWRYPSTLSSVFVTFPVEPVRIRFTGSPPTARFVIWSISTTATVGNRALVAVYRLKRRRAD